MTESSEQMQTPEEIASGIVPDVLYQNYRFIGTFKSIKSAIKETITKERSRVEELAADRINDAYKMGLEDGHRCSKEHAKLKSQVEELKKSQSCSWCGSNDLVCGKAWKDERDKLVAEREELKRENEMLHNLDSSQTTAINEYIKFNERLESENTKLKSENKILAEAYRLEVEKAKGQV